jgi:hypothetical protein
MCGILIEYHTWLPGFSSEVCEVGSMIQYIRVIKHGLFHVVQVYNESGDKYGQYNFYHTPTHESVVRSAQRKYRAVAASDVTVHLPEDDDIQDSGAA